VMKIFQLPYRPTLLTMMLSGLLGVWLHVLTDSFLYPEMNPFWPVKGNPFLAAVSYQTVLLICEVSLIAAIVVYPAYAIAKWRKAKAQP
jgi:membrane-bound metal-dependent hydrolase YbcI (DUF457 family)